MWFVLGLLVGVFIGILIASLLSVSTHRLDEGIEVYVDSLIRENNRLTTENEEMLSLLRDEEEYEAKKGLHTRAALAVRRSNILYLHFYASKGNR